MNLRESLNAISDVVNNRPRPLREFDQIFMKSADMLLQTEHVSRYFDGRRVVCIGDGDAIGLCLVHLHKLKILDRGPRSIHVLDFDERVVLSVQQFAKRFKVTDRVSAELYNVIDPLPKKHWRKFDGFYTNPPFGKSNGGRSVGAFIQRGEEAVGKDGVGCLVIADDGKLAWSQSVLLATENLVLSRGFIISELLPQFHHYHLDDVPDLTSCSIAISRVGAPSMKYNSRPLEAEELDNFYGKGKHLRVKYVRDLTRGGRFKSRDYQFELIDGGE